MSAIAHLPGRTWAATHSVLVLVLGLALVLVAIAVTSTVLLLGRDTTAGAPSIGGGSDAFVDTCFGAPVGSAC